MNTLILLSTYNGEKYLAAQLDSIIGQTYTNWKLLIRDDGSTDKTIAIIQQYQSTDHRIQLIRDDYGNLKSCQSFAKLMDNALTRDEDYIFFSDQDDVWLPEKLEKSIGVLQNLENQYGTNAPALVHTDLQVVDENLKLIHPSYLRYEGLTRNTTSPIRTLLINNYVTGCTMGINRALLKLATPIPTTAFMHDWWCALCAAASGQIGFVNEAMILYRQHGGNAIGSGGLIRKITDLITAKKGMRKRLKNLRACFLQSNALLTRVNKSNSEYNTISDFTTLPHLQRLHRFALSRKLAITPASKSRKYLFGMLIGLL